MRKVILFVQVSLDGFFEGPKKEIDWHMVDDELHAHVIEELNVMGAFLNGRVTYELMAGFWPTADLDPGSAPSVKEFARIWRDMPKVVYSKDPHLGGVEYDDRPGRGAGRGRGAQAPGPWGSRGRGRRPGRGLHGPGPDRRVPDLRPPDPDRRGEAPFSPFEGEGPAPPRRDPNFRERGRPSPVRTTPAP